MKVKYFEDTDTLYIGLSEVNAFETKELNENVILDIDKEGNLVGLTVEHVKKMNGNLNFSFESCNSKEVKSSGAVSID